MISIGMFIVSLLYSFTLIGFYDQWHWVPQTPEELIAEGICVGLLCLAVILMKLEAIHNDIKKRK
jgi:hypothetical protein